MSKLSGEGCYERAPGHLRLNVLFTNLGPLFADRETQ